jgi:hypothetical protein
VEKRRKTHRKKTLSKREKNASVEKGIGAETEDLTMMH